MCVIMNFNREKSMSSTATKPTQIPFDPLRQKFLEAIEKYKENHPEKTDEYEEFRKFFDALESEKTFNTKSINEPFCKQYFQYKSQSDGEYDAEYVYRTELKVAQNINEPFHINEPFYRKYSQYEGKYKDLTWLQFAIILESKELVQSILQYARVIPNKTDMSYTALHTAVEVGNADIVLLLIEEAGAEVEARTYYNHTPLHQAAHEGHTDIVAILLTKKANPNAKDNHENTPLHYAARAGHIEIVKMLVRYGAKVSAKSHIGDTAIDEASISHPEIAEYLRSENKSMFVKAWEFFSSPSSKEVEQVDLSGRVEQDDSEN